MQCARGGPRAGGVGWGAHPAGPNTQRSQRLSCCGCAVLRGPLNGFCERTARPLEMGVSHIPHGAPHVGSHSPLPGPLVLVGSG